MKKRTRILLLIVACCALLALPITAQAANARPCSQNQQLTDSRYCSPSDSGSSCGLTTYEVKVKLCSDEPGQAICGDKSSYQNQNDCSDPTCAAKDTNASAELKASCSQQNVQLSLGNGGTKDYGALLRSYFAMLSQLYNSNQHNIRPNDSQPGLEQLPAVPSAPTTPAEESSAQFSEFAEEVLRLVNVERAKEGLSPLKLDAKLTEAAEIRAKEIINSFSHTRPNGSSCFTALEQVGVSYRRAGENIALGQATPAQVVTDWMNSPGHRANIMNSAYSRIGIAAVDASRSSMSHGYGWAQFFAD